MLRLAASDQVCGQSPSDRFQTNFGHKRPVRHNSLETDLPVDPRPQRKLKPPQVLFYAVFYLNPTGRSADTHTLSECSAIYGYPRRETKYSRGTRSERRCGRRAAFERDTALRQRIWYVLRCYLRRPGQNDGLILDENGHQPQTVMVRAAGL